MSKNDIASVEELDELPPNSVVLHQDCDDPGGWPQYVYVKKQDGTWLSDGPYITHGRYIQESRSLINPTDFFGILKLIHRGHEPTQEQIDAYMAI